MKKVSFELTLFDDEKTKNKEEYMNRLEIMLDGERNPLPEEYYYFSDEIPFGRKVRVTLEEVE
jgi:hypothetical protein